MINILIVDDHVVIREGLKKFLALETSFNIAGTASNAEEALTLAAAVSADVILLDISMPGRSGLDIIEELKRIQPEVKILILSMHKEDQYISKSFRSGASGYLTKELAADEIISAIRQVYGGNSYIFPGIGK